MKTIAASLADIQRSMAAPKGQWNDFGKYYYRSCEDILQAVKPLLGGLVLTVSDEIKMFGDRIYVQATATLSDGENSVSTTAFAREALSKKGMDESQITGTASSYARKYALNGLLLIDDNKDADTRDNTNADQEREQANVDADVQRKVANLRAATIKHQASISAIKDGIGSGDLSTASEAWFELTDIEKQSLWVAPSKGGPFTTKERETMKTPEFRLANQQPEDSQPTGMFQGA